MSQSERSDAHLIETRLHSEQVLKGRFISVNRDTVRLPNSGEGIREYVVHPGAVVVIAMLDDDTVVIERQFRYSVGQVMLEFPAGKIDPSEPHLVCGERELFEETGYSAKEWAYAGAMHLAMGYSNEILHVYFARGLTSGEPKLDEGEFIEVIDMSVSEVLTACRDGRITDAKTLACSLWLQNVHRGEWLLDWTA
ncbi:MAG: NUDIX hydrolase [Burkholderiaceae bacterium]|nr:NUDIX hydrolase [Burkholderiaceae bacterium]